MFDYLLRYAINKIWCNPQEDKQFNFKLRRHTPIEGSRHEYVVEKERYKLPTMYSGEPWHVFQIGQVLPSQLGFPYTRNTWVPLAKLMDDQLMECEVFTSNGIVFPRQETFILLTQTSNLLIAVRENPRYSLLSNENVQLYLQIYTGAWFSSDASYGNRHKNIFGMIVSKIEDVRQFQIHGNDHLNNTGLIGRWYVNGRLVNEVSAATAGVGDYIELLTDSSIKKVVDFDLKGLPSFVSKLDSVRKYILHYPGLSDTIDFLDDIEVYLYKKRPNNPNIFSGVLYHRNKGNWLRMLTHKDYSIATDTIQAFIAEHPIDPRYIGAGSFFPSDEWNDIESLSVRLYIKHSGNIRPLERNASRVNELYMLTDDQIIRAMTGADAVAECWRAENLELSRYVGFMGLKSSEVYPKGFGLENYEHPNKQHIFDYAADAYGYYQVGKILSDSPVKESLDVHNSPKFELSFNFWDDSTIFEYDEQGLLLGYYHHQFGEYYRPNNPNCKLIEPFAGKASLELNASEGKSLVKIPKGYGFRIYIKSFTDNQWRDVTNDADISKYGWLETNSDGNNIWHWVYDSYHYLGYIRVDSRFYVKEMVFNKSAGMIRFNLDAFELVNDVRTNRQLTIPFGQYDIFLNNHSLIEGIDYIIKDNRVVISNIEYLKAARDGVYKVLVRGTGFCDSNLQHYKADDIGFVEYGSLSSNKRYNLHHTKVQRIVVDGRVLHHDNVIFDEDGSDLVMGQVRNGSPFAISQPQLVFREVFYDDYAARVKDDLIDKDVSNYLTFYLPKRKRERVDSIDRKYRVISAGCNLLLHLIREGKIKPVVQNGRLREDLALDAIKQYEWIKHYDILNTDFNDNHVFIQPHWFETAIGLDWWDYKLFKFLLRQFTTKELDLAPFVYINKVI